MAENDSSASAVCRCIFLLKHQVISAVTYNYTTKHDGLAIEYRILKQHKGLEI